MALQTTAPFTGLNVNGIETPAGNIEENKWYHVAAVTSGKNVNIYINGSLAKSGMMSGPLSLSNDALRFGVNFGGQFFNGAMDEVRIWNVARTQAQIQSAMKISLRGNEAGLVAYYRMDENNAGNVTNITGGLSGVLSGGAIIVPSDAPIESPSLQVSTTRISYGLTKVGITKSENVTLSNIGTRNLFSSITSDNSVFTASPSGGTLAPGVAMNITISYAPILTMDDSASITIAHNAPKNPHSIFVKGSGYEASSQNNTNQSALAFPGNGSSFGTSVGTNSATALSQLTVAAWINPASAASTTDLHCHGRVKCKLNLRRNESCGFPLETERRVEILELPYTLTGWQHIAAWWNTAYKVISENFH